jgi:hypothetical protein
VLELFMAGFVRLFLALGLRRPFIWVLAFMYVDIVAPQKIALAAGRSAIVAGGVSAGGGGLAVSRQQGGHPYQLPPGLMAALLFYCFFTTQVAGFLLAAAKWGWVWKSLVWAIILPFTLRTRLRLEAAALVMVLAARDYHRRRSRR